MRNRTKIPHHLLQAGFTLIELIIVIVIIGILAAIAIPKFQDLTTAANKSATKAVAGELAAAAAINYANAKANTASGTYTSPGCDATKLGALVSGGWPTGYTVGNSSVTGSCTLTNTNMTSGSDGSTADFAMP